MSSLDAGGILSTWLSRLGDPDAVDWTITLGYLTIAWLNLRVARRTCGTQMHIARERRCWRVFAIIMLLLGVNKQLDLQLLALLIGRRFAQALGAYPYHRVIQAVAVGIIIVLAIAAAVLIMRRLHGTSRPLRSAGAGVAMLLGYIAARSLSFTHLDDLLGIWVVNIHLYWALEIFAQCCILVSTVLAVRTATKTAGPHVETSDARTGSGQSTKCDG